MCTPQLDIEFLQYWSRLNRLEKESLLRVARQLVELKDDTAPISVEQYNIEMDEAMKRMDAGGFYTHEQAVAISAEWLNGK